MPITGDTKADPISASCPPPPRNIEEEDDLDLSTRSILQCLMGREKVLGVYVQDMQSRARMGLAKRFTQKLIDGFRISVNENHSNEKKNEPMSWRLIH